MTPSIIRFSHDPCNHKIVGSFRTARILPRTRAFVHAMPRRTAILGDFTCPTARGVCCLRVGPERSDGRSDGRFDGRFDGASCGSFDGEFDRRFDATAVPRGERIAGARRSDGCSLLPACSGAWPSPSACSGAWPLPSASSAARPLPLAPSDVATAAAGVSLHAISRSSL